MCPDEDTPIPPFNCETCRDAEAVNGYMDVNTRRSWHCGWMDASEWTDPCELPKKIGSVSYELNICPGWVVRQPTVVQCAQAYSAFDKGEMNTFFPNASNLLLEGVLVACQSFNAFHSERIKNKSKS